MYNANKEEQSDSPLTQILECVCRLEERLDRMEEALKLSREKEVYTTKEVAARLGKSPWTVRRWCSLGLVEGAYGVPGRGETGEWQIPHAALVRLENHRAAPTVQ